MCVYCVYVCISVYTEFFLIAIINDTGLNSSPVGHMIFPLFIDRIILW